jgi:hypothetical protein
MEPRPAMSKDSQRYLMYNGIGLMITTPYLSEDTETVEIEDEFG